MAAPPCSFAGPGIVASSLVPENRLFYLENGIQASCSSASLVFPLPNGRIQGGLVLLPIGSNNVYRKAIWPSISVSSFLPWCFPSSAWSSPLFWLILGTIERLFLIFILFFYYYFCILGPSIECLQEQGRVEDRYSLNVVYGIWKCLGVNII